MKPETKAANIFAKAGQKKLAAHERREAAGKEKDTPAIAKKEMSVLKKAKAPAGVMKYEKAEHKAMKFARGGGIESRGKTRGKFYAEGGDVDSDLEEVTPTALKSSKAVQIDKAPETFKQMFARKRAEGAKDFTWNGKKYTTELASNKIPTAQAQASRMVDVMKSVDAEKSAARKMALRSGAKKDLDWMKEARARREASSNMASGGSVKKFARGGGIESRGKTRGKFI